jgi:hypothetical protein
VLLLAISMACCVESKRSRAQAMQLQVISAAGLASDGFSQNAEDAGRSWPRRRLSGTARIGRSGAQRLQDLRLALTKIFAQE